MGLLTVWVPRVWATHRVAPMGQAWLNPSIELGGRFAAVTGMIDL